MASVTNIKLVSTLKIEDAQLSVHIHMYESLELQMEMDVLAITELKDNHVGVSDPKDSCF